MIYKYFAHRRKMFIFRRKIEADSLPEAQERLGERLRIGDYIQSPLSGVYWRFDGLEFEPYTRMI
jgi:hypothetical protein